MKESCDIAEANKYILLSWRLYSDLLKKKSAVKKRRRGGENRGRKGNVRDGEMASGVRCVKQGSYINVTSRVRM